MAVIPAPTAQPIALGTTTGGPNVHNILATVLVGGVLTPVQMQVVALATLDGTPLDMTLAPRLDTLVQAMADLLREVSLTNQLLAQGLYIQDIVDLEKEFRQDRTFGINAQANRVNT